MSSSETKKGGSAIWIIFNALQLIAIGVLVYMLVDKNKQFDDQSKTLANTEENLTLTSSELNDVRDRLMETKEKYQKLGIQKDELDQKLKELDEYVAKLRNDINVSESEKKKMKQFIANLNKELAEKDKEIARLVAENKDLNIKVDTLTDANQALDSELEEVTINRNELNEFIKMASVLSVDEMKISALKASGKEFEREEYRAKSIDRLKIRFSIADNKAADKDKKKFLVQLVLPSGEVFSDPNNGGGSATLNNGSEIKYTMSKSINFDNSGQELEFLMLKGFNYVSGNYIVNVACEGEMIGSGYFNVK